MTSDENENAGQCKHVDVHIDERPYKSPNPTSGEALYLLGHAKPGLKLYREAKGDREDPAIENGPEVIHLHEDEHFHSGEPRGDTIIVEGTPHECYKPKISYTEVVTLFDSSYPQHPEITYKVTYHHGPAHKPEGILPPARL